MKNEYKIEDWEKIIQKSDLPKKEKTEKLFFVKKAFIQNAQQMHLIFFASNLNLMTK